MPVQARCATHPAMSVRLLLSALLLAFAPLPAFAQEAPETVWAFDESDLPVDPDYRFGRLDNGMRYIVRHNATPAGQGMVWMRLGGGALVEGEDGPGEVLDLSAHRSRLRTGPKPKK